MVNECVFCKMTSPENHSKIVYEDDLVAAFNDIMPQAPAHLLIIPKKHIEQLGEIESDLSKAIFSAINMLTRKMGSFRIVMNYGRESGQAVPHLHFHLLSGRKLRWPPG